MSLKRLSLVLLFLAGAVSWVKLTHHIDRTPGDLPGIVVLTVLFLIVGVVFILVAFWKPPRRNMRRG